MAAHDRVEPMPNFRGMRTEGVPAAVVVAMASPCAISRAVAVSRDARNAETLTTTVGLRDT